jgi:hypothetical protein
MPDTRTHRGPAPEDDRLFATKAWPSLRAATADLCWLLDRAYALHSAAELVGNRYTLTTRQRMAIARSACADDARQRCHSHEVEPAQLHGQELWIDGLNRWVNLARHTIDRHVPHARIIDMRAEGA